MDKQITPYNVPYLDEIVSIIKDTTNPDRIILFGSYARGDYNEHSDIDILILKRNKPSDFKFLAPAHLALYKHAIGIAVDLLALDTDTYAELQNTVGYIYRTIHQEGKILYEHI
jgi:predicted nucleotidyltransferase